MMTCPMIDPCCHLEVELRSIQKQWHGTVDYDDNAKRSAWLGRRILGSKRASGTTEFEKQQVIAGAEPVPLTLANAPKETTESSPSWFTSVKKGNPTNVLQKHDLRRYGVFGLSPY